MTSERRFVNVCMIKSENPVSPIVIFQKSFTYNVVSINHRSLHKSGDRMFWLLSIARKLDLGYRYFSFKEAIIHLVSCVKFYLNISSTYCVIKCAIFKMLSSVFKITKYANARTDCIVFLFLTSLVFMNVRVYVESWFWVEK